MIEANTRVNHGEGVVFRRLAPGEGGVLLRLDSGAYHGVNETGSLLWELVGEGTTLAGLKDDFRGRLDASPSDLDADVVGFVEDLRDRGLLELTPQPSTSEP